jgi:hypothetical protein
MRFHPLTASLSRPLAYYVGGRAYEWSIGRILAPCVVGFALLAAPSSARAGDPSFDANDIETLFFIAKSDDRNRVDYGMRLDKHCAPVGEAPVFPYWREFEPPPPVRTKPWGLSHHDQEGRERPLLGSCG